MPSITLYVSAADMDAVIRPAKRLIKSGVCVPLSTMFVNNVARTVKTFGTPKERATIDKRTRARNEGK